MIHAKELIAFLLKQVVEVENRLKESTQMFEKKLSISEEQVVKKIIWYNTCLMIIFFVEFYSDIFYQKIISTRYKSCKWLHYLLRIV